MLTKNTINKGINIVTNTKNTINKRINIVTNIINLWLY